MIHNMQHNAIIILDRLHHKHRVGEEARCTPLIWISKPVKSCSVAIEPLESCLTVFTNKTEDNINVVLERDWNLFDDFRLFCWFISANVYTENDQIFALFLLLT
jgi:hypothetical protein